LPRVRCWWWLEDREDDLSHATGILIQTLRCGRGWACSSSWRPLEPDPPAVELSSPGEIVNCIDGIAPFAAGTANVIMQLSRLPIGHAVAASTVESGRLDEHPIKRLRTTLSYLMIAWLGTETERIALRREINRAHARVRSLPGETVKYDAFDRRLQLWVAACIYKGVEDCHLWLHGPLERDAVEILYRHGKRFGTTLQVPERMWPPNRAAFEDYWNAELEQIEMDEVTRSYLQGLARLSFLPAPFRQTLRRLNEFLTVGFLSPPFREVLELPWSDDSQRVFDVVAQLTATTNRRLPRPLREFPLNLCLWDARRRLHTGRPVI
jgi:uncharacterized protein (DUF2236 family)